MSVVLTRVVLALSLSLLMILTAAVVTTGLMLTVLAAGTMAVVSSCRAVWGRTTTATVGAVVCVAIAVELVVIAAALG